MFVTELPISFTQGGRLINFPRKSHRPKVLQLIIQ